MPKVSNLYLDVDPFKIIETNFHKDRAQVSESIFSLGNEFSGIRGFFDEGYSGKRLQGSYFNGIYEYALSDVANAYKGIVKRTHFTINSVNWVKCIENGEVELKLPEGVTDILVVTQEIFNSLREQGYGAEDIYSLFREKGLGKMSTELSNVEDFSVLTAQIIE